MREKLVEIFNAALDAADPYRAVKAALRVEGDILKAGDHSIDLSGYDRVLVVGAGKGTAPMAKAAEEVLGDRLSGGLVILKDGHSIDLGSDAKITLCEAAHPLPDSRGVEATERVMELARGATEKTLVVCLLSGGGSSLLVAPAEGITLGEKMETARMLMAAGADIFELNTVRKHLSRVKGGHLAAMIWPATVVTLLVSDVPGDRLDSIASGPTVPDPTTYADALAVLEKYELSLKVPPAVKGLLELGAKGEVDETPSGSGDDAGFFEKASTVIVAGIIASLDAARSRAEELGFDARVATSGISGNARDAAHALVWKVAETKEEMEDGAPPVCLLSGGETTVVVTGDGLGGRNQELALAFALEVEGSEGITLLSAGTDGTDGPTDAAGAVVDGRTVLEARRAGLDPVEYIDRNDSYAFFDTLDRLAGTRCHFKTGPTGTNVMDIQVIAVEG